MDLYPLNADRVTDITDIRAIATYLQKVYNKHPDSLGGAARRRTCGAAEGLRRRPLAAVGVVCRWGRGRNADAFVVEASAACLARDHLAPRVEDSSALAHERSFAQPASNLRRQLASGEANRAEQLSRRLAASIDSAVHALRRVGGARLSSKEETWHLAARGRLRGAQL